MLQLAKIQNYPNKSDAKPGMAYFYGTGPSGKTCKDCVFRGLWRRAQAGHLYRVMACEKFKKMTGKIGPDVKPEYKSCKYFEQKLKE